MANETEAGISRGMMMATAVLSAVIGAGSALLTAGLWLGSLRASLDSHVANPEIHQSRAAKEGIAQTVVDREVRPALADIVRRLERIEDKLDERRR
jgi:hypothetical protein